jgi:RHS repeat-associated protein
MLKCLWVANKYGKAIAITLGIFFVLSIYCPISYAESTENSQPSEPSSGGITAQSVRAQSIPSEPTGSKFSLSNTFGNLPGDSIDPGSGALTIKQTDLLLPGKGGLNLEISRSYNSKEFRSSPKWNSFKSNIWEWMNGIEFRLPMVPDRWSGWMGEGWQSNIGGELTVSYCTLNLSRSRYKPLDFSDRVIVQVNSSSFVFDKDLRPLDKSQHAILKETPDGYQLITKDGTKYKFEKRYYYKVDLYDDYSSVFTNEFKYLAAAYYLSVVEDLNGNQIQYVYEQMGDGFEREWKEINWIEVFGMRIGQWGHWEKQLKYKPYRPSKVIDTYGREVNIHYQSNNADDVRASMIDSISYKDSNGSAVTYQYIYDGNNCLTEVVPPQGNPTKYNYTEVNQNLGDDYEDDGYILTKLTYSTGAVVGYAYDWYNPKNYSLDLREGKNQALSSYVVSRRTVNNSQTWNYSYSGGELYSRYGASVRPDEEYNDDKGEAWNIDKATVTDPIGESEYEYEKGLVKSEKNAEGHVAAYGWDYDRKNLLSMTLNKGGTTIKTEYQNYDDYGNYRILKEYGDLSNISDDRETHLEYVHDSNAIYKYNNIVDRVSHSWVAKSGKVLNEVYNDYDVSGNGNLIQKREALDTGTALSSFKYDSSGNIISATDPNGNTTNYEYAAGSPSPTRISNILTQNKEYYFDTGLLRNESDYNGNRTSYQYDSLGRLTRKSNPDGTTMTYAYYDSTNQIEVKDENNHVLTYKYDNLGRLDEIDKPGGLTDKYQYNAHSKITSLSEAGKTTSYSYDRIDRLTGVTYPDGSSTCCDYLDSQNSVDVIDAEGNTTRYKYDGMGQPIEVTEANGNRTYYSYADVGKLASVADPRGLTTSYSYDRQSRLTNIRYSDGTASNISYDKVGNLIRKEDAKGQAIGYSYDPLNRLTRISYPNSTYDVVRTYDESSASNGKGQLTGMTDASGKTNYSYDNRGRISGRQQTIGAVSSNMNYAYDGVGNIKDIKDPIGNLKTYYVFDDLDRIIEVKKDTSNAGLRTIAIYSYNPGGAVKEISFLNGFKTAFTYDRRDRLDVMRVSDKGGDEVLRHDYDYDSVGNRTALKIANVDTVSYTYDKLYRLTGVAYTQSDGSSSFEYDPAGNRTELRYPYGDIKYAYNSRSNRLDQVKMNQHGKINYSFDANGNLTKEEYIKGEQTSRIVNYKYDPEDRLIQVTSPYTPIANLDAASVPDQAVNMTYDGNGNRVRKISAAGTTIYHNDLTNNVICETNENGQAKAYYIYANGQRIALVEPDGKLFFYHNDVLGSPALISDENGKVVQKYLYEPFGTLIASKGMDENHYTFTGKEYDLESDLLYFGARYYDPKIGRFITRDIANPDYTDPQTINRYVYCLNNPVRYVDPTGMWGIDLMNGGYIPGDNYGLAGMRLVTCLDYSFPSGYPVNTYATQWYGPVSDADRINYGLPYSFHNGVDLGGGGRSGTLVRATGTGKIEFSGWHNPEDHSFQYGRMVVAFYGYQHEGYSTYKIYALYGHLMANRPIVATGDIVMRGDIIGRTGETGWSNGNHLHFSIMKVPVGISPLTYGSRVYVNPRYYIDPSKYLINDSSMIL